MPTLGILDKALAAVVVVLLIACAVLYAQNAHLSAKVAKRDAQISSLTEANGEMSAAIKTQNAAVAVCKGESDGRIQAGQKIVASAESGAKSHDNRALALEKATAVGTDCVAANSIINGYLGGLRK